ncbi:MAG TPA: hypothetical protein VGO25_07210, partial [Rhodanobacteraceae bacterium]|nr:hypothetical protein [Rhodanobacteraceae bacterium]
MTTTLELQLRAKYACRSPRRFRTFALWLVCSVATFVATAAQAVHLPAPTVEKAFSPTQVSVGGTAQMTITLTNDNGVALTGVAFADSYPTGMANASTGVIVTNTCGGAPFTADPGGQSAALVGGTIPANGNCVIVLNVVGTAAGAGLTLTNHTGSVTSINAFGSADATADLTVTTQVLMQAPIVTMTPLPASITVGGFASMLISLTNPNVYDINGVQFTINYPTPTHIVNADGGAILDEDVCAPASLAPGGGTSLTVTNATIPAGGSCVFILTVAGTTAGDSDLHTGSVLSANASPGADASTTLSVTGGSLLPAPRLGKTFSPNSIKIGGTSQLTFTFTNEDPNNAVTGLQQVDLYPYNIANAPNALVSNTCGGLVLLHAHDGNADDFHLFNGMIPPGGICNVVVNVVGTTAATGHNAILNDRNGNAQTGSTASADVAVTAGSLLGAPTASKQFFPTTVAVGAPSQMTITLTNANSFAITGAQFTDNYPDGMVNASNNPIDSNDCGGAVTADPDGHSATLVNGTIPAVPLGSCKVVINVVGALAGPWINQTGEIPAANALTGASTFGALTVSGGASLVAPTVSKAFVPQSILVGATAQMSITLTNNDPFTAITGAQFTDSYPGGMANASSNVVDSNSCFGTVTAPQNGLSAALANGTIPAGGSCEVVVNIVGTAAGAGTTLNNHTGPVNSTNANPGADASATLTVTGGGTVADLTLTKTHAANFTQGQTGATYTMVANNIGASATNGTVTVADTLPASLTATAMSGSGWTCVLATTSCTRSDALAAGLGYPAITLTVNVAVNAPASVTNTATVNGGGETNTANDSVSDPTTIAQNGGTTPDLTLSKKHAGNFSQGQTGAVYSLIANNVGGGATNGTVTVTDTLPASLTATALSGPGWACTLATTSCTHTGALGAGTSYPAITLTVNVAANAPANVTNTANVSGGGETTTANDSASDPTTIDGASAGADLSLTKNHAGNFSQGQAGGVYSLIAHNVGAAATSGTVTVTDVLPSSLTATAMSGPGWTCTLAALSCTRTDALAMGASYPAITLTVNVAANAPASVTNTANVSGGGETNANNDAANDPTTIDNASAGADLTLTKNHAGNFSQNQTGAVYSLIAHNIGGAASNGAVTVTDALPGSLTATAMSGPGWTCALATTSCTRSDSLVP